jgi:hypothetical protein
MPISLDLFLGDLTRERFFDEVWDGGYHFVRGELGRYAELAALPLFESGETMLQAHRGLVPIFMANGGRNTVQKRLVEELLELGSTAYLNLTPAGALDRFREALAEELGCHPDDIVCEGFISRAGAYSTGHFDPEHNFHFILSGQKRWRVAHNKSVRRPLTNYVMHDERYEAESPVRRYLDEPIPTSFPIGEEVTVTAGDTIYFAPGVWHEVRCDEDALSVNFAVRPDSWAKAIAYAVEESLHLDPEMRVLMFGRGVRDDELRAHFEEKLRARVHEAVDRVTSKVLMKRIEPEED